MRRKRKGNWKIPRNSLSVEHHDRTWNWFVVCVFLSHCTLSSWFRCFRYSARRPRRLCSLRRVWRFMSSTKRIRKSTVRTWTTT